jgi:SAM-dependent methyltransferase
MNPWLSVPAADYEAHMAAASVGQLPMLSRILRDDLERHRPRALVVPGCATGNGFEHIDPLVTSRIVGIDVNGEYLALLRERHARRLPGLELLHGDLFEALLEPGAFDLVHAALVLEYVDPAPALARMAAWLRPGGVLTVVLQEPSPDAPPVSRTPFRTVLALEPLLRLVDPALLALQATKLGLVPLDTERVPLPQGKSFLVARYASSRT